MRSYVDEIGEITGRLREQGALALLLIDAGALASIEHGYGIDAFERTRDQLHSHILEACESHLGPDDLVVSGELGSEQVAIFLFRPRGDDVSRPVTR